MSFANFSFDDGGGINLNLVRSVRPSPNGHGATLVFSDGTTEHIKSLAAWSVAIDLEEMQAPVIAAAAGFELLGFWFFDEEPNVADVLDPYHRGPIVAWRITRDGPKPISIQLSVPDYESGMSAILRPDGVVIDPLNQSWRDINMWAEDVIARWKEWREKRKADAA